MSIEEHRLHEILSHVAAKYFVKDWTYKRKEHTETIENYIGVLIPFTVVGICNNKEYSYHVFVKVPSLDESIRKFSGYMWNAEVYVYSKLVTLWKRISNVQIDELIPRCYYADATLNNQAIVLKDMRYEGFQKYNEAFLDFDHVVVSLKCLAQFHALTLILKKAQGELDISVLRPYTDKYPREINKALQESFRRHSPLFNGTKYQHYLEVTLNNYKIVATEAMLKAKCLVYGHGDYWKENIMFKYENNCPVKACTFDFQTCQVTTPAHDFLYFILNSTRGSLRRIHYHHLLDEYYATLKTTLSDHDIQLDLFYTKEDFIFDLKIVAPICFIRICMSFSLWLGFEYDSLVKSKKSWENDQQREKEIILLKDLLVEAMEDLHYYGYICL